MIIECPRCKQRYNVMNSTRGEVVVCQSCGNGITLPEIKNGKAIKTFVLKNNGYYNKIKPQKPEAGMHNCIACGTTISDDADVCPRCGKHQKEAGGFLLGVFFGIFGIIISACIWGGRGALRALQGMGFFFVVSSIVYIICMSL